MTNNQFAILALAAAAAIAAIAYFARPDPILPAAGGKYIPRDELIRLNDN